MHLEIMRKQTMSGKLTMGYIQVTMWKVYEISSLYIAKYVVP